MATNIKRAMLSFSPAKYGGKNTAGTIRVYNGCLFGSVFNRVTVLH